MAHDTQVSLDWYQNNASVLEYKSGRTFEVGSVWLNLLDQTIVGYTYAHHILPISNNGQGKSLWRYRLYMGFERLNIELVIKKIQALNSKHPEISLKMVKKSGANAPEFFDLHINIPLYPVEYATFLKNTEVWDFVNQTILEKIRLYLELLGSLRYLEVLIEER